MAQRHLVHVGETLETLAKQYYGNPNMWSRIFNANVQQVKNPDSLTPGTLLVIPD